MSHRRKARQDTGVPFFPRLVDRCQVVRYSAETEALALSQAEVDRSAAAAAGFAPVDEGRWDTGRLRPTLVVEYRFYPPATISRTISTSAREAKDDFAMDAVIMASAGYVPDSQRWHGRSYQPAAAIGVGPGLAFGWSGPGTLEVSYRFNPELAGEPVDAVVLEGPDGLSAWWVIDP